VSAIIGERLAELRKDAGLDQTGLARLLSLSHHTISSYERNKSTPNDELKVKIAEIFNVSLDYLLGLINEPLPYKRNENCVYLPENATTEAKQDIIRYIEFVKQKSIFEPKHCKSK